MDKQTISQLKQQFDLQVHVLDETGIEFCYARELMSVLGYERWENFSQVIEKAKVDCENSQITLSDHFRDIT